MGAIRPTRYKSIVIFLFIFERRIFFKLSFFPSYFVIVVSLRIGLYFIGLVVILLYLLNQLH